MENRRLIWCKTPLGVAGPSLQPTRNQTPAPAIHSHMHRHFLLSVLISSVVAHAYAGDSLWEDNKQTPAQPFSGCVLADDDSLRKLVTALAASAAPAVDDLIVPNEVFAKDYTVVAREFSPDRTSARYVFDSPRGIFRFELNIADIPLSKIIFVIRNQQKCEGLELQTKAGKAIDLRRAEGVTVRRVGNDLEIEFLPAAIASLRPGGTFQFVNEYR